MTEAEFAAISLKVGLFVLITFMFFIMWDLAKKSNAGKFGTFIIFLVLGLALMTFVIKEVVVYFLDK